ncbi:YjbQ family protein [Vibrio vulnificus]|nr:YjbQ family protein [Vibrio vulnificus]
MSMSCVGLRARPYGHIIRIRDMPAHIKASTLGCHLTIPISQGRLALGTWQGIYLGEHRDHGGQRRIMATLYGE